MVQKKCSYFDRGFCKNKDECLEAHPALDCDKKCEDRRNCFKRHRIHCKDGDKCVHNRTKSCEFIHETPVTSNSDESENLKNTLLDVGGIQENLQNIYQQISRMDVKLKEMETPNNITSIIEFNLMIAEKKFGK